MVDLSTIAFGVYCLLHIPALDDGLPPHLLAPIGPNAADRFPSVTQQDLYGLYHRWGIAVDKLQIVVSIPIDANSEQRKFIPLLGDSEKHSQTEIIVWMETWNDTLALKAARIERVRYRLLNESVKPDGAP